MSSSRFTALGSAADNMENALLMFAISIVPRALGRVASATVIGDSR